MRSLLFALLVSTAALFAQTPTAVVNGTVVDTSGAVVPDARVVTINQETNVVSQKATAADGTFTIVNLLPGNYVPTVEKGGFKKGALPVFKLDVNQTLTERIELQVGSSAETVTISAESVGIMLQRAITELGTTIDEQMMHELPLNGRNFTELSVIARNQRQSLSQRRTRVRVSQGDGAHRGKVLSATGVPHLLKCSSTNY
jgi:hypothetical protein